MIFHSSSVTGCTDRRAEVSSDILASDGVCLTRASVTGVFSGSTARKSTMPNLPVRSLGSG